MTSQLKFHGDYEYADVTDHAFLPRKIRPVESKSAEVALVAELGAFLSKRPNEKAFYSMAVNWLNWMKTPPLGKDLEDALSKSLPMAVPLLDHNAVVLFNQHGNSSDKVLVSAIDIWPHDLSIHSMSNDKQPFPSDCRLAVPRYSAVVHRSQVESIVFLEQLSALGDSRFSFPEREPTSTKARHEVIDTRKPAHPVYVFEWLMATLQQLPDSNVQHQVLFKRVRLESIRKRKDHKPWTRSSAWVALKSALHAAFIQLDGFESGGCRYKLMMAEFKASLVRHALGHYLSSGNGYQAGDIVELNAHLARTAAKLQQRYTSSARETLELIRDTTEQVEEALKCEWEGFLKKEEAEQQIDLQSLMPYVTSPICDVPNPMNRAKAVLRQALVTDNVLESMRALKNSSKSTPPGPQVLHNNFSDSTFEKLMAEMIASGTRPDDMERTLQAVEIFIRTRLWPNRSSGLPNSNLEIQVAQGSSLLKAYKTAASDRYKKSPIRMSKMMLYSCTLLGWIDSLCVTWDQFGIVGQHRLFGVEPAELECLLLMDAFDLELLHELSIYLHSRMDRKLESSIADVSASSLAVKYAKKTMWNYETQYQIEVEQLTNAKIAELNQARKQHKELRERRDRLECECKTTWSEYHRRHITTTCSNCNLKTSLNRAMDSLEKSVSIYERRYPENEVARLCVIFHSKIPEVLRHYRESCAFMVDVCLSETTAYSWSQLNSNLHRWSDETPFNFLMALGSNTKSFGNTHYRVCSILRSDDSFLVPQGKNVKMGIEVKGTYRYLGTPQWDLSSFCQLPIADPYTALKFTVYGVQHSENDVLVKQCLCPAELQLVAFKDFGTLRAGGGHLQWRNIGVALESGILDLCDSSVAVLLLTAAYQVGPLPAINHWNYDLTESAFVEELCHCVRLVMDRIEPSWNSSKALYICICLLSYVADHTEVKLSDKPLNLLSRCRTICIEWSDSIEKIMSNNSKAETTARHLYFVNGLVVLTFGAERSTLPDDDALFDFLRARTIMYERNLVMNKDAELDHLAALCIRTSARHQLSIHQLIGEIKSQALNRLVTDRWNPKKIGKWSLCSSSTGSDFYWAECEAQDDTHSVVHIEVIEGTFLVDGEPVGRLPERILTLSLFQRVFPDASLLAVFHRGGGVFETKSSFSNRASYTFALNNSELIIREIDGENIARRLLPWQSFHDDLPQNLVEKHIHWMTYRNPEKSVIELRPLKDQHSLQPVYKIQLNQDFQGQVLHCETSRKMLSFTGEAFDHIYETVGWRLDQKRYIEPYWPALTKKDQEELADNWSVCLYYTRLHLHMEICIVFNQIKVTVLEYENMVVSSSQYLGSFIGLKHMLVLERLNGLRTVIIPHFEFQAFKRNSHHCLVVVNNFSHSELGYNAAKILDSKYTSFAFDEDPSLDQMRPNGEETYEKWLMCAYLHGATCSAMVEPLTGLTGLEMAMKQLRRCRLNKPLSPAALSILHRIEQLAVKRSVAYDTQLVNWPDVHSSYSCSDAYILLVNLIRTKSMNLIELYGTGQEKRVEDCPTEHLELVKHGYSNYEWIYSPDAAQLDSHEKRKLGIKPAEAPILPFTSNVLPSSCSAYKLTHASMCTTALKDTISNENFSWVNFIQKFDCVSPVYELEMLHVGYWTELCFDDGSMWLTLLAKAIICHSMKRDDQVLCLKRFTQLLSFAAWKLSNSNNLNRKHTFGTYITALGKLLKLAMSSNDSEVTAQLPSIKHLPSIVVRLPSDRFLNENKINFGNVDISEKSFTELAEHWSIEKHDVRSKLDSALWDGVKRANVWTRDTLSYRTITITTERSPVNGAFLNITSFLPIQMRDWEKYKMVQLAQEYYEELFHRQQLYAFVSQLDNQDDIINQASVENIHNCPWPCVAVTSLDVALLKKPNHSVSSLNDLIIRSFDLMLKDEKDDAGQCPELEEAFHQCLIKATSLEVNIDKFPLRFGHGVEERPISTDLISKLRYSWEQHQRATENATQFQLVHDIRQELNLIGERAQDLCEESWANIIKYYKEQREGALCRIQSAARVFSPVVPRILFPLYGRGDLPVAVQRLIEKHLIYQVYAQKAKRCLLLLDATEAVVGEEDRRHSAVRLVAEISEPHCSDGLWTPKQRPKWLLFEVENDVIIRKKQVLVANAIIAGNKQILQLNMGEGKTSVITPLVCSALASSGGVVRITLLTSLLETHGQELALRLGGILEHSVYYFPCNRGIAFIQAMVSRMISQFKECLEEGGSIVTAPEHRLSMLLKFDELCIRQPHGTSTIPRTAATLLDLFNLFRLHVVDIVDESDEILRHKYQLLYTIGSQQAVDGGERRWKVVQQVLQLLRFGIDAFCQFCAENVEELRSNIVHRSENGSASWPSIRLIGDKLDDLLKRTLIEQVLSGNASELNFIATLNSSCTASLRRYLLEDDDSEIETVIKPQITDSQWLDILVLRGLLTYKVLHHCLKKRWSVDYGVDVKTRRRLVAVPFRGKDTPMERTDFGHPDVGLVFTHLSYYYSGLDEKQIKQALELLKELAQRDAEYLQWIDASGLNKENLSSKGIVTDVNAINLEDPSQVSLLVDFFRFNMTTIHFWLNTCVLPKETKQFPSKLVASSWDLARPQSQSMRGFSGTKDSSRLLPIQVELGSLEQLGGTDGDVLHRMLRPENRQVFQLNTDVCSADEVIDFIVSTSAQSSVLIDVGALMVGMSNRQVAEKWLSKAPKQFVAAAYFDGDRVTALLRDGHSTPLAFSPLKQCLGKVLIYLDDIHTRGTDFKFPIPSRGVVTLGRDLPKDKLVQAAMRMRQLGHGHSVSFLAPREIYSQLRNFLEPSQQFEPDSSHVLAWALSNTVHQLEKGMLEWAAQGNIFSRREAAIQILNNSNGSINPADLKTYLHLVQIPEITLLEKLYGPVQSVAGAVDVVSSMINKLRQEFKEEQSTSASILSKTLDEIGPVILGRCEEFLSDVQVDSRCLDEEQERELEEELEEEREVHRPGPEEAFKPENSFDWIVGLIRNPPEALRYLKDGKATPLLKALERTTVYSLLKNDGFDARIVNSYNFRRTLKIEMAKQDEFVRPPRWALAVWSGTDVQHLVLLSPVEANIAICELRLLPASPVSLHRFAPRTRRDQSELLISGLRTGYAGPPESLNFAIPALNLFGSISCCLERESSSIEDVCRYLSVVPPPCANSGGLLSSDWRILVDGEFIRPDGFVDRGVVDRPVGISDEGWESLERILSSTYKWSVSSVTFFRALISLRNMDAWFGGSDLSSILLPTSSK